jgi:hypothetical protein
MDDKSEWSSVQNAALDDLWQAGELGRAWAEAEAALPEGWVVGSVGRNSAQGHTKGMAWEATAYAESPTAAPLPRDQLTGGRWSKYSERRQIAYGSSRPEALRALAAKLRVR